MILDCRTLAKEVLARTKTRVQKLPHPPLVRAIVGSDTPATLSYLKIKAARAKDAGCEFETGVIGASFGNADAIIVQLPLPKNVNQRKLLDAIPLQNDADVLSTVSREKFEKGDAEALLPPVVSAIRKILEFGKLEIAGKRAVVIGAGFLVGEPAATWLRQQGATVEVITLESGNLTAALSKADIIVSGAGSPHLIKPDMLKEGDVLIDAGTSETSGKVVGDADPACAAKCALFTPVPGGVGPLAVACLFENVITLVERAMNAK